jgi:glutaredoxin 3
MYSLFFPENDTIVIIRYIIAALNTMVKTVEIYTWSTCPFCIRAKHLLDHKGVTYTEYCIDGDRQARAAMTERAKGHSSLPQIFIDDQHIGGCDDLHELEYQGKLDQLLTQAI